MPEPTVNSLHERLVRLETEMAQFRMSMGKIDEMHTAFFKPVRPSKPALIDRIYAITEAADNSRFAYTFALKVILTAGAVAGALTAAIKFWINGGTA